MNSVVIDFFKTYILPGRAVDASSPAAAQRRIREDDRATALQLGGKLYDLIQRVHAVHCQARRASSLGSHHISQAVQIWHDLDNWDPDEGAATPDHCRLYRSYQSAIFIWVYFIIHPGDVDGWKAQEALRTILVDVAVVDRRELVPFLVIPLFLAGLTAVNARYQEVLRIQYERVCDTAAGTSRDWWDIVQARWAQYNSGRRPAWDWIS